MPDDGAQIDQFFDSFNWGSPTAPPPPPSAAPAEPLISASAAAAEPPLVGAFTDAFLDPDEPPDQQTLLEIGPDPTESQEANSVQASRDTPTTGSGFAQRLGQVPWPYWVLLSSAVGILLGILGAGR